MGTTEQSVVRQAIQNREPIPERIQNAPELLPWLGLYFEAFLRLDSERSEAPIPWSKILAYAERCGYDEEQTDCLIHYVRALEPVIDGHRSKKAKERMAAAAAKTPKGRKR